MLSLIHIYAAPLLAAAVQKVYYAVAEGLVAGEIAAFYGSDPLACPDYGLSLIHILSSLRRFCLVA